jgi:NAD(P)-dependent dehydrogenase (short-subunit alcohol dehydrogenase family)
MVDEISTAAGEAVSLPYALSGEGQMSAASELLVQRHGRLRSTVPELRRSGGSSVAIVSSIHGSRTFTTPGATAYRVTNAGQVATVRQLALGLARHYVRISAFCGGGIESQHVVDGVASWAPRTPGTSLARPFGSTAVKICFARGRYPSKLQR